MMNIENKTEGKNCMATIVVTLGSKALQAYKNLQWEKPALRLDETAPEHINILEDNALHELFAQELREKYQHAGLVIYMADLTDEKTSVLFERFYEWQEKLQLHEAAAHALTLGLFETKHPERVKAYRKIAVPVAYRDENPCRLLYMLLKPLYSSEKRLDIDFEEYKKIAEGQGAGICAYVEAETWPLAAKKLSARITPQYKGQTNGIVIGVATDATVFDMNDAMDIMNENSPIAGEDIEFIFESCADKTAKKNARMLMILN